MKRVLLEGASGRSVIAVGESIGNIGAYCGDATKKVIVTEDAVRHRQGHKFPPWHVVSVEGGEASKSLTTMERIYNAFLRYEVDRSSVIVGIGGGVVCDLAGFAASTYLRGLRFGFVPTTLLAQVDAGVGGKNGINFKSYKNLMGTFNQPGFVLCDPDLLLTLPVPELRNGFAEVVKHAAIADGAFFSYLEKTWQKALSLDPEVIGHILYHSIAIKSGVVALDEKEAGERRKLNFGHTLGHGLEKVGGLRHGEAVSIGMAMATRLSAARGLIPWSDVKRLERLLLNFGLPVTAEIDVDLVWDALKKDKKREDRDLRFVFLEAIGKASVVPVDIYELKRTLHDLRKPC